MSDVIGCFADVILAAFDNGDFDPVNNEEHAEFLAQMGKTPEEWAEASEEEQRQMIVDHIEGLEARVETAQDLLPKVEEAYNSLQANPDMPIDPEIFSVTNGVFDNALLEEAAMRIESAGEGVEFDRSNLAADELLQLYDNIRLGNSDTYSAVHKIVENNQSLNNDSETYVSYENLTSGMTLINS